jgi:hypothetical protein
MLKIWGLSQGAVGLDDWVPPHSAERTTLTATSPTPPRAKIIEEKPLETGLNAVSINPTENG